jgi:hypothetical protein
MRAFPRYCWGICLCVALAAVGGTASAQVLATDLGPDQTYSNQLYIIQGNPVAGENVAQSLAVPFTPDITAPLEDVLLPLFNLTGGPNSIIVDIAANASGAPGSILSDLTEINPVPSSSALVTFACDSSCPELQAGTEYWILTGAPFGNTFVAWDLSPSSQGDFDFNNTGTVNGPWFTDVFGTPGYEVDGTPEPSSAVLVCLGLVGLVGWRRSPARMWNRR